MERWNLFSIQRIAVAEKYRPIYEKQAKKNMSLGGRNYSPREGSQISSTLSDDNKIDVRAKLAKTASVSTDTYSMGKKILDSNNEELKQEVLSGEKNINAGYKELTRNKKEEKTNADKKSKFYQKSLTENLPQAILPKDEILQRTKNFLILLVFQKKHTVWAQKFLIQAMKT